jgi:alpha-tubulin suppressor-like RCC1 family protein
VLAIALLGVACQPPSSDTAAAGSTSEESSTSTDASDVTDDSGSTAESGSSSESTSESSTTSESGASSESSESGSAGMCGDGIVDADEQCDDAERNGPAAACTPECTLNVCGDGYIRNWLEACDDGPSNGDGLSLCTADCELNDCGDLYVHESEECDLGEANGDHESICTAQCTVNVCGDHYVFWPTEQCDDGDADDGNACLTTCMDATCGDGFVHVGEEGCDEGAATGDGASPCSPTCSLNSCGDGYLHASEACDEGDATGDGVSECTPACQPNTCGDGYRLVAVEQCDPELPSITCADDCTSQTVPVVDAAVGYDATCVLFEPGVVRCWGRHWPVDYSFGNERAADVPDLDIGGTAVQLAASDTHACVLLSDGDVRCWGNGEGGRLGYGNTESVGDDETPASVGSVDVGGTVVQVAVGAWQSCALIEGGEVRCWGHGDTGALGYGNTESVGDDETPASIGSIDIGGTVVQVAAGGHTCAVLDSGALRCWGDNEYGQLGYASTETIGDDETPASVGDVDIGGPVVQVAVGSGHTCVVLDGGAVRCWGDGGSGRLGYANTENIGDDETPASVGDVEVGGVVTRIEAGYHTCAILDTNTLRCWGSSTFTGQLGYESYMTCSFGMCDWFNVGDDETPASVGDVPIEGDFGAAQVAAGGVHTCAVLDSGALRCWGLGWYGVLGYGAGVSMHGANEDVPL